MTSWQEQPFDDSSLVSVLAKVYTTSLEVTRPRVLITFITTCACAYIFQLMRVIKCVNTTRNAMNALSTIYNTTMENEAKRAPSFPFSKRHHSERSFFQVSNLPNEISPASED